MLTVVLVAVGVPSLLGVFALGTRRRSAGCLADRRGIALQTVIIMVVLLVIAGAIAAVLLARGQTATSELERQDITQAATAYQHKNMCLAAGYSWHSAASRAWIGQNYGRDGYSTITTGNHCREP